MGTNTSPGDVYGRAARSLNGDWVKDKGRATAGAKGEHATARVLNALAAAPGGPTVLHDMRIPLAGVNANVDHVVITGRTVYLIDSKYWRPALYWTVFGTTFRGLQRFEAADKQTMPMAWRGYSEFLTTRVPHARLANPLLVVWPSSKDPMRLGLYRAAGAKAITGAQLESRTARWRRPADPDIVAALTTQLI